MNVIIFFLAIFLLSFLLFIPVIFRVSLGSKVCDWEKIPMNWHSSERKIEIFGASEALKLQEKF
jgi:hypothetical protein